MIITLLQVKTSYSESDKVTSRIISMAINSLASTKPLISLRIIITIMILATTTWVRCPSTWTIHKYTITLQEDMDKPSYTHTSTIKLTHIHTKWEMEWAILWEITTWCIHLLIKDIEIMIYIGLLYTIFYYHLNVQSSCSCTDNLMKVSKLKNIEIILYGIIFHLVVLFLLFFGLINLVIFFLLILAFIFIVFICSFVNLPFVNYGHLLPFPYWIIVFFSILKADPSALCFLWFVDQTFC